MKALLIKTDGYSIESTSFADIDSAKAAMAADYTASNKNAVGSAEYGASHFSDTEALLYDGGFNVFVWKIVPLQMETESTKKACTCQKILQNIAEELDYCYENAHNLKHSENEREFYENRYYVLIGSYGRVGYDVKRNDEDKHVVSFKTPASESERTSVFRG